MGTTIVDALIVTLGLDGSKFKSESVKAKDQLRKFSSESESTAKVLEAKGKQAAQFYTQIRNEALALVAVFTGGRALKNFAEDTINSAANLGMMADNLTMSTEKLSAYQRAAERAGGSAQGITAQLQESQAAAAKHAMGMFDESMQWFYRMGGSDSALKDGNSYLMARADIVAKLYAVDPGRAKLVAQSMGIAPEQFNLIKQGSAGLFALVGAQEKNSAVTRKMAGDALMLRNKMLDLRDRLELTATTILLRLAPAIERGITRLEKMADWVAAHRDDISAWVNNAVESISQFVGMLDRAAQSVGGWHNVLLALIGLKLVGFIANIVALAAGLGSVATGLGGIAGAGAAAGVVTAIGGAALTAGAALLAMGGAVWGLSKAMDALDPEVDEKNHPGQRRVRRRGKPDEWVKDDKLSQEHAGEHYVRGGRSGGWVKDAPTKGAPPSTVPAATPTPQRSSDVSPAVVAGVVSSVTQKLMAMGWTQKQAAGIAGSLQQESNLDPAARNPASGAYGIAQWLGSRVADFKKVMGKDLEGSTLDEQLKFHQWELTNGNERSAGAKLRATTTAEDAAKVHAEAYERPGADEAAIIRRQANALNILARLQVDSAAAAARLPQQAINTETSNTKTSTTSTHTSETNFTGPVTINTQATDAAGIAQSFGKEMGKFGYVPQANTGML